MPLCSSCFGLIIQKKRTGFWFTVEHTEPVISFFLISCLWRFVLEWSTGGQRQDVGLFQHLPLVSQIIWCSLFPIIYKCSRRLLQLIIYSITEHFLLPRIALKNCLYYLLIFKHRTDSGHAILKVTTDPSAIISCLRMTNSKWGTQLNISICQRHCQNERRKKIFMQENY